MKKLIIVAAIIFFANGTLTAQTGNCQRGPNKNCPTFVDKNKDGICDNAGSGRGQGIDKNCKQRQTTNVILGRRGAGNCINQSQCARGTVNQNRRITRTR